VSLSTKLALATEHRNSYGGGAARPPENFRGVHGSNPNPKHPSVFPPHSFLRINKLTTANKKENLARGKELQRLSLNSKINC
jgi:hypothetical protein